MKKNIASTLYGTSPNHKLTVIQRGKNRSIIKECYQDTKENYTYIVDNDYLANLEYIGLVQ